jgi:hypothetical protein
MRCSESAMVTSGSLPMSSAEMASTIPTPALHVHRFDLRAADAGDDDLLDLGPVGLLGESPARQGQLRCAGDQRQRQAALEHGFPVFL